MVDTAVKDGKTLFDFMDKVKLQEFNNMIHDYGIKSALAGSVKKDQLQLLYEIGCDVVGIRGAACTGGDRNNGTIHRTAVHELKNMIENF